MSEEEKFALTFDPFLSVLGPVALFFIGVLSDLLILIFTWHISKKLARLVALRFIPHHLPPGDE